MTDSEGHVPSQPKKLISRREAARIMSLSEKTLARAKDLPCVKIGSRTLYRPEDLDKWIASKARENLAA